MPKTLSSGRAFGPVFKTRHDLMGIRYMTDADADGAGDGESAEERLAARQAVIDKTKSALKATTAQLKAYADIGLSAEEIRALVDKKDDGGAPDAEAIEKKLRAQIESEARAKTAAKFRASSVREQAATLGFINPGEALALVNAKALADVDVDDDDEVDAAAVKKLLDELATASPHLLKPKDNTPDHRNAGIGGTGSGSKPEVQPGRARLAHAYENSSKK